MNKEEQDKLFEKCFIKTLKKLAEEPDEVINYNELLKKYNNLLKEKIKKDKEIERLNNIINEYVEDMENYLESDPPVDMQDYTHTVSDVEFLEKGIKELKFITTIKEKLNKLKELKENK